MAIDPERQLRLDTLTRRLGEPSVSVEAASALVTAAGVAAVLAFQFAVLIPAVVHFARP